MSKDSVSTLPQQKTHMIQPMYKYQGFWYHERHLLGVISSQRHLEAQDSDVFVVTFPKCGTTWMKAVTFALLNRKRHRIASEHHPLLTRSPHDLVPFFEINLYVDGKTPDIPPPPPRLLAAHMPFSALPESIRGNSKCKVVYMWRDPKDTLVSLWHFLAHLLRVAEFLNCPFSAEEEESGMVDRFSKLCSYIHHIFTMHL